MVFQLLFIYFMASNLKCISNDIRAVLSWKTLFIVFKRTCLKLFIFTGFILSFFFFHRHDVSVHEFIKFSGGTSCTFNFWGVFFTLIHMDPDSVNVDVRAACSVLLNTVITWSLRTAVIAIVLYVFIFLLSMSKHCDLSHSRLSVQRLSFFFFFFFHVSPLCNQLK